MCSSLFLVSSFTDTAFSLETILSSFFPFEGVFFPFVLLFVLVDLATTTYPSSTSTSTGTKTTRSRYHREHSASSPQTSRSRGRTPVDARAHRRRRRRRRRPHDSNAVDQTVVNNKTFSRLERKTTLSLITH